MGMFSIGEDKIQAHIQSALQPGEQVQQIVLGTEKPFWTKVFFRIGVFFWKNYVVATTNQRVLFVEYAGLLGGFKSKRVDSVGYNEGVDAALGWGIFNKDLSVKAASRGFSRTVEINRFMRSGHLDTALAMVGAVNQMKQMGGGGAGQLPR
jgi:hypothetical protein